MTNRMMTAALGHSLVNPPAAFMNAPPAANAADAAITNPTDRRVTSDRRDTAERRVRMTVSEHQRSRPIGISALR